MSWWAVGITLTSATIGQYQQRENIKANNRAVEQAQRANTSAVEQALEDEMQQEFLAEVQADREALRASSTAVAQSANTGVAGITAERNIDNVLFQNLLDENVLKANSEANLFNISNQGFSQAQQIQSRKKSKPKVLGQLLQVGLEGAKTYVARGGGSKGKSKGGSK